MSIRATRQTTKAAYILAFIVPSGLVACADAEEALSTPDLTQALDGTLSKIIVDGHGPRSGAHYYLLVKDTEDIVELAFATPPKLSTGAKLSVLGVPIGSRFSVTGFSSLERDRKSVGKTAQPLIDAPLQRTRNQGVFAIDLDEAGMNATNDLLRQLVLDTDNPGPMLGIGPKDKSARQYYSEVSYGVYKVRGNVEGPFAFGDSACVGGIADAAVVLRNQLEGTYDAYAWYFGSVDEDCGYAWGEEGTWSNPAQNTWFNGRVDGNVFSHEMGHNIGLMHASTIRCDAEPFADEPLGCTTDEYGSRISVMGTGGVGHLNAVEKWYLTWFGGCNGVHVRQSGTWTLLPIETACNGIQALQIPMPKKYRTFSTSQSEEPTPAKYYYLELRTNQGLDTGTTAQIFVHVSDDIKPTNEISARTLLLDMVPTTPAFDGLKAGESYTDPSGGLVIRVESLSDEKAMVTVTMDENDEATTCMDDGVLIGPGPDTCDEPFDPTEMSGAYGYRTVHLPDGETFNHDSTNGVGGAAAANGSSVGENTANGLGGQSALSGATTPATFGDPNGCGCRTAGGFSNGSRTFVGFGWIAITLLRRFRSRPKTDARTRPS